MGLAVLQDLRDAVDLPELPEVALRALEATEQNRNGASTQPLPQILAAEGDLIARTLTAVNSGFYGNTRALENLDDAITVLGQRSVQIMSVALSVVLRLMERDIEWLDVESHWRRSLYAASAARAMAETIRLPHADTCFLIGLLMDVGMLVLAETIGEPYTMVLGQSPDHEHLCEIEKTALGMNHAEATGVMAQRWKLAAALRVPMAAHHEPDKVKADALRQLAQIVWLSGRCADIFVLDRPTESLCNVREICSERFGLSNLKADAMLCNISRAARDLAPVFNITIDERFGYEAAIQRAGDDAFVSEATMPGGVLPTAISRNERRRAKRIERKGFITIYPRTGGLLGKPLRMSFHDVSTVGIGLIHNIPMKIGVQFVIKLPQGQKMVPVIYTVLRCIPLKHNTYHIGAEVTGVMRENA